MRAPLSWLRDFAPFGDDAPALATTLTELGLVVEEVEQVGEGLEHVVVARVEEIDAIQGADRIRRVVVDAGNGPLEIVCGAWNFSVGDLLPLAPVGAVLPGGFEIGRRKMKGVTSNGMLCSGRELALSDDGEGLLLLTDVAGAHPGQPLTETLGIEPDVVFDITVEGNRPDAWSMAGIARDLAGKLGLPFSLPQPPDPDAGAAGDSTVDALASLAIEDLDMCPRMTVRVLTGVTVGPSPRLIARRLTLAGMRPINNVVDASNYVMLELGQPTHPYDLDRLPGPGLRVRRARQGETVETLDGVERSVGTPGRGLGQTGEDCLICDAEGTPVGLGGIMGGSSSEIAETTTRVLLETAYFTPMVIARTSRRLALRTEASARFERGCDPWGIERAAARFCELVRASDPGAAVASGLLDVRGDVPAPVRLSVPLARVNGQLGLELGADEVDALLSPLGFACEASAAGGPGGGPVLVVTVPTARPDVRQAPYGVDDVIEEVARTYGYGRLPRRQPSWPEPGGLTFLQRQRRAVRDVLCGLGALEAWTPSFVADRDHERIGLTGRAVEVTNPLAYEERWLRRALLPGLLRALAYNADRRQGAIRLYEVGVVFSHPEGGSARVVERAGAGGLSSTLLPGEREMVGAVFAGSGDDARTAVAAWSVLAESLGVVGVRVRSLDRLGAGAGDGAAAAAARAALVGLHPTRAAALVSGGDGSGGVGGTVIGSVGEVDPAAVTDFGLSGRVGWLEVDLGMLVDRTVVTRRPEESAPVSRYPSSDIDLALVVADDIAADTVADVLDAAGGELLESVQLFDVFRGPSVGDGRRSLAYRLRFCALERTLTDAEVGELRTACIDAAAREVGAVLR